MKGETPFNAQIVHYDPVNPNPIVEYLDHDENTGYEVVRDLDSLSYTKNFPLGTEEYTLQELIDAGVPLKEVNPKLYFTNDALDAGVSQSEMLAEVQSALDKITNKNNSEE